ncbi:HFR117Wp [Eremothecium sinecaudum]|uniref:HFR117Wp n=1 Tax=Eremothecium sinecaudum TaxID=45286 RepID=A0A0X8HV14_9SACH|nr:HFR117Wp [Eremothecium sinecaudum]AMD21972.1 HFR117Wp [Eremothecium sinecaudum]
MGGILKNKSALKEEEEQAFDAESVTEFRQQVLKNTRLNAQLTSRQGSDGSLPISSPVKGGVPKDTLSLKREQDQKEALQWNQVNLDENEIAKLEFQSVHVDEPKTPYQGAIDPNGEYYRHDDEDDLESLTLGEPQYRASEQPGEDDISDDQEHEDCDSVTIDKRKKFAEMRKKHYDVREVFNNRQNYGSDEEE